MEGDMLSDTGGRDELWDLMVQDRRGQSGEDGSFLLDSPKNGYCLLGKGKTYLVPSLLDGEIQVAPASRFLDVLPFQIQHVASSQTRLDG